jgi:hypothetical protein
LTDWTKRSTKGPPRLPVAYDVLAGRTGSPSAVAREEAGVAPVSGGAVRTHKRCGMGVSVLDPARGAAVCRYAEVPAVSNTLGGWPDGR